LYKQNKKLSQNYCIATTMEMLALEKGLYQTTRIDIQLRFCRVPILASRIVI